MAAFPDNPHWEETASFLERHLSRSRRILAPREFLLRRHNVCDLATIDVFAPSDYDAVVVPVAELERFPPGWIEGWLAHGEPVFANETFVVVARTRPRRVPPPSPAHLDALEQGLDARRTELEVLEAVETMAVARWLTNLPRSDQTYVVPESMLDAVPGALPYGAAGQLDPKTVALIVIDHHNLRAVPEHLLEFAWGQCLRVHQTPRFDVLAGDANPFDRRDLARGAAHPLTRRVLTEDRTVALVTTYLRPWALARSLPAIRSLDVPVLVVDDGSPSPDIVEVERICAENGAELLTLPRNRGLAGALNVGLSYWLADPDVEWISYFQDDVEVRDDILEVLGKVQDAENRPVLTGRRSEPHPEFGSETIEGVETIRMRTCPGVHLHASADYWRSVLPIPAPYAGAPKLGLGRRGQGADEDHWVTAWASRSITKRGGFVTCVPGLVRTFSSSTSDSTWGESLSRPDPPFQSATS